MELFEGAENGMQVAAAEYDRQAVADHANNLATKIRGNLTNSMKAIGVDILTGVGSVVVRACFFSFPFLIWRCYVKRSPSVRSNYV